MYQLHTLENGLKILMVPVPAFQSISVGFLVGVGSRYESEPEAGMSHFVEHMLFKGTGQRPSPRLIAEAIEGIGGVNNAYTSQDTTVYYAKVADTQTSIAINFLADLVKNPLFRPADIEKERMVIGEELKMAFDIPESWVNILVDQVMWPDHPLGRNIGGTRQSLAGISRDTLLPFFQKSYHPNNVLIAIGGSFVADDIVAQVTDLLGDWRPAAPPAYVPAPPLQSQARCAIEHRTIEQGHLCLAIPALARRHPDRFALSVLNTVLGDGMSSRLFQNIREERGLAYAVDSGIGLLQDTGALSIYAGVAPSRAAEALQAILDELERLRQEPVPAKELHKAKEYLKGRMVLGLEDSYSRAAWVAYQVMFMDRIKSPEEVLAAYNSVTAADVQRVAQTLLEPTAYNLAAVGPFGQDESLAQLVVG